MPCLEKSIIARRYVRTQFRAGAHRSSFRESTIACRDHEARGEALHIPFEGAGQCLVEVVEIEHQSPLRRAEHAEVREVGVTAELHRQPGMRHRCQIGRHDRSGAPKEREGRDRHPPVTHRHQCGKAGGVLRRQDLDGVETIGRWTPSRLRGPGCRLSCGSATRSLVGNAHTAHTQSAPRFSGCAGGSGPGTTTYSATTKEMPTSTDGSPRVLAITTAEHVESVRGVRRGHRPCRVVSPVRWFT